MANGLDHVNIGQKLNQLILESKNQELYMLDLQDSNDLKGKTNSNAPASLDSNDLELLEVNTWDMGLNEGNDAVPTKDDLDKNELKDHKTRNVSLDAKEEGPTKEDLEKAASMGIPTRTFQTVRNLLLNTTGIDLSAGNATEDSQEIPSEVVEDGVEDREKRSSICPESPPGVVCILYNVQSIIAWKQLNNFVLPKLVQ